MDKKRLDLLKKYIMFLDFLQQGNLKATFKSFTIETGTKILLFEALRIILIPTQTLIANKGI